jgi:predicted metal-dependent phosphoesterase TrpH
MVYADLHVHTDNSDGRLSIEDVPAAARRAGVSVVAVTDHDRYHPALAGPVVERSGVTVVHGIELRVETPTQRVDLLGYGLTDSAPLHAELDRLGADRAERGRVICDRLEAELGIELDLTVDERTGRAHLARAVVDHPDTTYEAPEAVFEDLIGEGRPCYESRDLPSFEEGRRLLADAAGVVGLAHPFRYDDPERALDLCAHLDAVERHYPYDRPAAGSPSVDEGALEAAIERHDLLSTGGSDAHGEQIGTTGLDRAAYRPVHAALSPEP